MSIAKEAETLSNCEVVSNPDKDGGAFIATVPTTLGKVEQEESQDEGFESLKAALEFTLDDMSESREEILPGDTHPGEIVRNIEFAA